MCHGRAARALLLCCCLVGLPVGSWAHLQQQETTSGLRRASTLESAAAQVPQPRTSAFTYELETTPEISFQDALMNTLSRILVKNSHLLQTLSKTESSKFSLRRHLAIGDFDELNALFSPAVINLPDAKVSRKIGFWRLKLDLTKLKCTNIHVGDILISYQKVSNQLLTIKLDIVDLDMDCNLKYDYDYGVLNGDGRAKAQTENNDATVTLAFASPNFDTTPPTFTEIQSCNAKINVDKIDFDGGFVASILDIFKSLIANVVEDEVSTVACDELGSLGTTFVSDFLAQVADFLEYYLGPPVVAIPLAVELGMQVAPEVQLMNLQDTSNTIGQWFDAILQEVDALLGAPVEEEDGTSDLGVNVFLRENVLDADRALTIDVDSILPNGAVLFDGHDKLTETTIELNTVRLFGLDTFTKFDPLLSIGKYTLNNQMSWQYLTVELDVTITIKPSTLEDSVIETPSVGQVVETVKIEFGVDNLQADVAVLLAINQDVLGGLPLGPLLDTSGLLPCLLSTLYKLELTGFGVSIGGIREPTLEDFVSPGIDRVVSTAVRAVFAMYERVLLSATGNIFETKVKEILNDDFLEPYMQDPANTICALQQSESFATYIDFRDLLLEPDVAENAGGTGQAQFGNVAYTLMKLLREQFLGVGDNGLLKLNSMLIAPWTEGQSGVEGMLQFPSDLFNIEQEVESDIWSSLMKRFQLKMFNTRLDNLDTFTEPISLLEPTTEPTTLTNLLNLGPVQDRPFNGTLGLLVSMEGEDSPLTMYNEMDISFSIPSTVVWADVVAKIVTERLMEFPLRDVLDYNCWLATIPAPDLFGIANDKTLGLSRFFLQLSDLDVGVNCVNCTSPGVALLPDLLDSVKETGIIAVLRDGLENFSADLLQGDWLQLILDRLLHDSSKLCPHSPDYVEGAVATDYGPIGFPNLSRESVETLVLAGATAAPMAIFVTMESQALAPPEPTDPLSGQASLVVPEGSELIDFSNLGETVGPWADTLLEEASNLINNAVNGNSTESGDFDLVEIIRDLFLDDEGVLSIPLDGLVLEEAGLTLILDEVRITGLDSITSMYVLEVIGPQTLRNNVKMDKLGVELSVRIGVNGNSDTEEMTLAFGVNDVNLSLALMIPLDLDRLGKLELGSLLNTTQIFPCLLSTLMDVDISQFLVTVGGVDMPSINGFLSDSLQNTISSSMESLFTTYERNIVVAFPRLTDGLLRGVLNSILKGYVNAEENSVCPTMSSSRSAFDGIVDFRDLLLPQEESRALGGRGDDRYGDVVRSLFGFVKERALEIDQTDGTSALNDLLIRPLTEGQSDVPGTLLFEGDLFNSDVELGVGGLNALIELRAYNARIERLDTLGEPLELLQPIVNEPSILNNTATFGLGGNPLRFSVALMFSLTGDDDMQVLNEVEISVDLESATVVLGALLKIAEEPFLTFPLEDITNLNCWLATIPAPVLDSQGVRIPASLPSAGLVDLAVSLSRMGLNITCISCSSPDLEELAEVLSSPEAQEDATAVGNRALDYVTSLLGGNFLQIQIDRMLNEAAKKCPNNAAFNPNAAAVEYEPLEFEEDDGSSVTFLIAIVVVASCLAAASVLIFLVVRCIVRRRHRAWLRSLATEHIVALHREQKREVEINSDTKSMFTSPVIPLFVRLSMPIVILGNIGFFLSGHLSDGATVNIEANLFGESFTVEQFFEFSMAKSTVDIWNAGGKELAILILIFSGIWPYTKQLITLVLWFLPPRIMSVTRRGSFFYWLDALAKWSMVDIFALVISIAAFRVSIESPDVAFLTDNFYTLDLMVVPLWGLYANMTAQLISQVSSHFIILYHRRIVAEASKHYEEAHSPSPETVMTDDNESMASGSGSGSGIESHSTAQASEELEAESQDQLCQHAFVRPHRGLSDKLQVRRGVNVVVVVIAIAIVFLVVFGCSYPTFSIEVLGVIGVAVESGQQFEKAVKEYSVFNIVSLLMEEARFLDTVGDYIGLGVLSVLFIMSVLVVPLVQTLALLRHWFSPMTRGRRSKLVVVVEILQAWQYIEVYLIAVIVSAWQLGPVSDFMINSYCDDLESTFATLVYYGILEPRDAQCFMVEASVESATYMLIAAAILLALLNTFITKAAQQYHRDTDATLMRFEAEDPKMMRGSTSSMHSDEDIFEIMEEIHPVNVMFTDTFRWVLRREDIFVTRSMRRGLDGSAKLGVKRGFPQFVTKDSNQAAVDGAVPVILAYPEKSPSDAASDDQSDGDSNLFAANGAAPTESFAANDEIQPRAVASGIFDEDDDDDSFYVSPTKGASKNGALQSLRSLFSFRSKSSSAVDEAAWQCEACFHTNGDGKNKTCALCGVKRDAVSHVASSDSSYLTSSVVDNHTQEQPTSTEPPKTARGGVGSSWRSLFSLRSVASSNNSDDECEWKCESCSYGNIDGRNNTCALCGVPRAVPSSQAPDAESSIVSSSAPSLMTIPEAPNETYSGESS